jgi:hypothetical protein
MRILPVPIPHAAEVGEAEVEIAEVWPQADRMAEAEAEAAEAHLAVAGEQLAVAVEVLTALSLIAAVTRSQELIMWWNMLAIAVSLLLHHIILVYQEAAAIISIILSQSVVPIVDLTIIIILDMCKIMLFR